MKAPIQIVFALDVLKEVPLEEVRALIPSQRERIHVLKLSEYGMPIVKPSGPERSPIDWTGLAEAVVRMVAAAREHAKGAEVAVEHYVTGFAPLPVFAHVGAELSWDSLTIINKRKVDGTWVVLPLTRAAHAISEPFFSVVPEPPRPSDRLANGRIAVFVSCGKPMGGEKMAAMIREQGESVAQLLEINTREDRDLNEENGIAAAQQLNHLISNLGEQYPNSSGLALFIGGPAQLAVIVGRALNPTIHSDVWIANLDATGYERAFALPWRGSPRFEISQTAEAKLRRLQILADLNASLATFREELVETKDAPPESFPLSRGDRARFFKIVKDLQPLIERSDDDEPFHCNVLKDNLSVSPGLLEAMAPLDKKQRHALGQLFVLHELFHVSQGLRSPTYHGIGRAGFALEEIDYWADAFALGVLATTQIRHRGPSGAGDARGILTELTGALLRGLVTFDRFGEQQNRIQHLPERRARRYLIWHLQHARAETITKPAHVWQLLGSRPVVELAPLEGGINASFDKIASKTLPERTELFIVLNARLMRQPKTQSFDPARILEAIRAFDDETIQQYMHAVLTAHEGVLVPWRTA